MPPVDGQRSMCNYRVAARGGRESRRSPRHFLPRRNGKEIFPQPLDSSAIKTLHSDGQRDVFRRLSPLEGNNYERKPFERAEKMHEFEKRKLRWLDDRLGLRRDTYETTNVKTNRR